MSTTYPYKQSTMLVNSITADTIVSLNNGMQVAQVTFNTAAGPLGQVTLSPVQPIANNIEFKRGEQVLQIVQITFQAAFGFDNGQVSANGQATDQQGKNPTPFESLVASWAS